ncbi:uncharacterized protein BDV17DRAFT_288894 [Aspergillus undulatus]|uniref:uncharacterized protein n=1 Tax=Aspergillus undulatus TaxID=1810928 RepID=UPI003CCCC7AD
MTNYERAYARRECRSKIFEYYVIDNLPLEQVMSAPVQTQWAPQSQVTVDQWKWWFKREKIFKNLNAEEAIYLKRELATITREPGQASEARNYMVIAGNELLIRKGDIDKTYACIKVPENVKIPTRRSLIIIQMPSEINALRQPEVFRNFQRLIFNTRVHFDSSFEANLWAPDERGVHARRPELRGELEVLSDMHNQFNEACKQFKLGNAGKGWAMVRTTFELNPRIVQIHHHRLFPDLLGILLLLQQHGLGAAPGLDSFFELIMLAPLDSIHHLYLTFDGQCRQLRNSKVRDNDIRSYYSYNQASFPRADQGEFYSLFKRKTVREICGILGKADEQFGAYSTEAFCLWHTALQYLSSTEQYEDMAYVSGNLCVRLEGFKYRWDHSQPKQLNSDAAMSFYLHGDAEDARGNTMNAINAFSQCIMLRSQVSSREEWDSWKGIALRRLEAIASRVGDGMGVGFYQDLLDTMYSDLEAKDVQAIANFQPGV